MSLRDMLTSHLFKRGENGHTIVYPWGVLGRGYILPAPYNEVRMRRRLGALMIGAILLGVAGSQLALLLFGNPTQWPSQAWVWLGAGLLAYTLGYRLIVAHLVQDLASSPARLGLLEAMERQAQATPRWFLRAMLALALVFCVAAAAMTYTADTVAERCVGFGGLVLFAIVLAQSAYGLGRHMRG